MHSPRYQQLAKALLLDLAKGIYPEGQRFPSRRRIEGLWSVSRPTVEHALGMLTDHGVIEADGHRMPRVATGAAATARQLLRKQPYINTAPLHSTVTGRDSTTAIPPGETSSQSTRRSSFLYDHLIQSLMIELASGAHEEGRKFLSRRKIEAMWNVSRPTAERALGYLTAQKILVQSANQRSLHLAPGSVDRARLMLRQMPQTELPPPETWAIRRHRLIGKSRPEGHRIAIIADEASVDRVRLQDISRLVTPAYDSTGPNFPWYLVAFLREANRHFCDTEILHDDGSEESTTAILKVLSAHSFGGVVVVQRRKFYPRKRLLAQLKKTGTPVITFLDDCEGEADFSIDFNEVAAGYDAMQILVENGHRNILVLTGPPDRPFYHQRCDGALAYVKDAGLENEVKLRFLQVTGTQNPSPELKAIISNRKLRPTAIFSAAVHIFCRNDAIFKKYRLRVPRDISVIGCGNSNNKSEIYGPVDLMVRDVSLLGTITARTLIEMINGTPIPRTIQVEMPYLQNRTVRKMPLKINESS